MTTVDAYRDAASAWATRVSAIYSRLAQAVVGDSPVPLAGARVLDLGTGTGVVSALAVDAGARVIGLDLSEEMLRHDRLRRAPGVVADALHVPFRLGAFDMVIAACLVNHFLEPAQAIRVAASVVRPGGAVVASAFSAEQDAMKAALDDVARSAGWRPPEWYAAIKRASAANLGDPDSLAATGRAGGLVDPVVHRHRVDMTELSPDDAVAYRFSLPPFAPWLAALPAAERDRVVADGRDAAAHIVPTWRLTLLVLAGAVS